MLMACRAQALKGCCMIKIYWSANQPDPCPKSILKEKLLHFYRTGNCDYDALCAISHMIAFCGCTDEIKILEETLANVDTRNKASVVEWALKYVKEARYGERKEESPMAHEPSDMLDFLVQY